MFAGVIRHGTILAVVVLVICVLGVLAALRIPVQMIPDLEVRVVSVDTRWPGATPQDVEKEILIEQEEYLRALPGLERMISTASYGSAEIQLEFPFGVDINEALIRVNNALSQVPDYPENVDEPSLEASSFSQNSFMYFRVAPLEGNPRGLDMTMMRDFVEDEVRTRMPRVRASRSSGSSMPDSVPLMSSIRSRCLSRTAQTRPSKSLRVISRYLLLTPASVPDRHDRRAGPAR